MRLWSLHPQYLDRIGLIACWREGLLARHVLLGLTRGYKNHPQLVRFKAMPDAVATLDAYLLVLITEAGARGYHFQREKLGNNFADEKIPITDGQLAYELHHLQNKLRQRSPEQYAKIATLTMPQPHPSFIVIPGSVADWEKQQIQS